MANQKVKQRVNVTGLGVTTMIIHASPIWENDTPVIKPVPVPYFHQFNKHSYKQKK